MGDRRGDGDDRAVNVAREPAPPVAPKEPPGAPEVAVGTHEGPVVVEPQPPPRRRLSPAEWARENLFNSWFNALLTVVLGGALAWAILRAVRFILVTGRWEIVERNLRLYMVFRFPGDELWRLWAAAALAAVSVGLVTGVAARLRALEAAESGRVAPPSRTLALRRAGPLLALVAVLLVVVDSALPIVLTVGAVAAGIAGNVAGRRVPPRWSRGATPLGLAGTVAAYLLIAQFGGVGYSAWGGLLLTLFLAAGGIVLSFPIGVALALGRRSTLPAIRLVSVGYIELIRGVPLITLLFMSFFVVGFFLPVGTPTPEEVTRALIALVLFTAAYLAEIVRGGLQSVPRGQIEAAQALGLSPLATTRRIVLPQALRAVIPAIVGQFISLFKDTSLVAIIGLTDLLGVALIVTQQPDFLAQGLIAESLAFAGFIYWVGSYSMSRESQRLERRLGVGER